MDHVEGRILWDGQLPGLAPEARREIYDAMNATLARLHTSDIEAMGLSDFGKPGNYFGRQVDRWTRQYLASETRPIPAMNELIDWLARTLPEDDTTSVVHGDYRLDNMILHPTDNRVIAVLDWELSTLGNPMADFTYQLMQWVLPGDQRGGLLGLDLAGLGIPSIEEYVAAYCERTGRSGIPELDWYFAYNMFRLAAICQGIAGRVRDGTAASPQAVLMGERVEPLALAAQYHARRAGM
jgi:aminoglycoside phosphotransferase (APT) family kinase protein